MLCLLVQLDKTNRVLGRTYHGRITGYLDELRIIANLTPLASLRSTGTVLVLRYHQQRRLIWILGAHTKHVEFLNSIAIYLAHLAETDSDAKVVGLVKEAIESSIDLL